MTKRRVTPWLNHTLPHNHDVLHDVNYGSTRHCPWRRLSGAHSASDTTSFYADEVGADYILSVLTPYTASTAADLCYSQYRFPRHANFDPVHLSSWIVLLPRLMWPPPGFEGYAAHDAPHHRPIECILSMSTRMPQSLIPSALTPSLPHTR